MLKNTLTSLDWRHYARTFAAVQDFYWQQCNKINIIYFNLLYKNKKYRRKNDVAMQHFSNNPPQVRDYNA